MNIYEIRYKNARYLAGLAGGINAVAEKLEKAQPQISHLLADKPIKNIGFKIARQFEAAFNKPVDWLDHPHQELYALPTKTVQQSIAENIISLMTQHRLTQSELATKSGLSQKTISNIVNLEHDGNVTIQSIEKLARYFEVEPYQLLINNWFLQKNH